MTLTVEQEGGDLEDSERAGEETERGRGQVDAADPGQENGWGCCDATRDERGMGGPAQRTYCSVWERGQIRQEN